MLKAKKANRVLRIPEERQKDYLALGYTIENMDGTVVAKPDSPADTIKELKAEIAKKDARIKELEKKLGIDGDKAAEKPADNADDADADDQATDDAEDAAADDGDKAAEKPAKKKTTKK